MNNELVTRPATLVEIRENPQRFPRIGAYPEAQALRELQGCILKACALRGQAPTSETIAFMANALREELLRDEEGLGLRNLSMEELRREIRAAALGNRGELYGVNVASLFQVLCTYAKEEGARAAREAYERRQKEIRDAQENGPISSTFNKYVDIVKNALNANK